MAEPLTETTDIRLTWARCTLLSSRCDGRMEPWRGSDGHGGCEIFHTCDRCGRTR